MCSHQEIPELSELLTWVKQPIKKKKKRVQYHFFDELVNDNDQQIHDK